MRIVVALGGNALLGGVATVEVDAVRTRLVDVADELDAIADRHALVVTYGNGEPAVCAPSADVVPLDVLGAESEGIVGYLLEEALASRLPRREVAVLLTQVEVLSSDPSFRKPAHAVGPIQTASTAAELAATRGWTMMPVLGSEGFRRVVASPEPRAIREISAIRALVEARILVICAGGGGIPVVVRDGIVRGAAAVVDKDLTAALLAAKLDADLLVLLTDVPAVYADWPGRAERIAHATPKEMRARNFSAGSMATKVEAACRFAEATGRPARIGSLGMLGPIVGGRAGTTIARRP